MHIGICPVRISFAGGGTDLPEYFDKYSGNVIGTAINKFTYVIIHSRLDSAFQSFSPDFQKHYNAKNIENIEVEDGSEISSAIVKYLNYKNGMDVILCSDVPAGSGLGSSSSLSVNLINTLNSVNGKTSKPKKIAETAFKIEREILKWPMGKQDEYFTATGGLNYFEFKKNTTLSKQPKLNKKTKNELEKNLLLFFVGTTRKSSSILNKQIQRIQYKNSSTITALHYVKELAKSVYDSLNKSDITKFGELLHEGWIAKKNFSPNVTTKKIDLIYKKALKNGALGGKLTGAGGGGHLLLYCDHNKQKSLKNEMKKMGLQEIPFLFYNEGPKVFNSSNLIGKNNVKNE